MEIKTETIMVEQKSILYVAKDGKEFTTQKECELHEKNMERDMKEFADEESAKEYAAENLGKYEFQKAKIGEDTVILCGTCIPYEDEFYQFADEMLKKFDFLDLDTSTLRDKFIEVFEKYCNARFVEGCDEF